MRAALLAGLLLWVSHTRASAECPTNQSAVIDLSSWSVVQYGPFPGAANQPPAIWTLSQSNTVALQSVNANASILLSQFVLENDQIEGSWLVGTNFDNDFIGFVFGYQDASHFYLFDWRRGDQLNNGLWGFAERGMCVKAISANTPLTPVDLGSTYAADTNRVRLLYHNLVPWVAYTNYQFNLKFQPGHFTITVSRGPTVLANISIDDATFTTGNFGFYNWSEGQVRYSGFTRRPLPPRPFITAEAAAVMEGDVGTTNLTFTVSLSNTNCDPTLVDYRIAPGTAAAGTDYLDGVTGTLLFAPGETNKEVTVTVIGDLLNEADETLFLIFSNAINGTIANPQVTGTILNDDPVPLLHVGDVAVPEGQTGTNEATFSLTLSAPSGQTIEVEAFTIDGSALNGTDYLQLPLTLTRFSPGATSATVTVQILGDRIIEPDETFYLALTNALNVTLENTLATGLLLNDDSNQPPTVQITFPADGAIFAMPPGLVPIQTAAQDIDGFVTTVEFSVDGFTIGAVTNPPFDVQWTALTPGTYSLTAVATDDAGAQGTSQPVRIVVRECDPELAVTPLSNQVRCACESVTFSTVATSREPVTFAWRANGSLLPGETNSILTLHSLKPHQSGLYSVEVITPCAVATRTASLTITGSGNENPIWLTNAVPISAVDHQNANPYPSSLAVGCVPGVIRHLSVTLNGVSHNFPDDLDILLVSPGGLALKLMSDAGGGGPSANRLTNVVLTFSDTATRFLPDASRITPDTYLPTDYNSGVDIFTPPAPGAVTATNFTPFLGTDPNGVWSLFVVDDLGGDAGALSRGWSLSIEWADSPPRLSGLTRLADGRLQMSLEGLPLMTHTIEASADLVTWTTVAQSSGTTPTTLVWLPDPGDKQCFFRAVRCP